MALNIRNQEADRLAREVARATGETKTQAVIVALEERLARVRRMRRQPGIKDDLLRIARDCANLPVLDARAPDAILGYDDHGLPH